MADTRSLTFLIPSLPPRELWPNRAKAGPGWDMKGWHGRRAKVKAEYSQVVYLVALKAVREAGWLPPNRVTLTLVFIVPTRRRYDTDNLFSAFKSGLDAIVTAGVLWSDGPDCIVRTELPAPEYQKGKEGVRVTVTEVLER